MTTKPLISITIFPSLPYFSKSNTKSLKLLKVPPLSCIRKNGSVNGFSRLSSKMESGGHDEADDSQDNFQTSKMEQETKNNDIWRLFREAQQNILYLNKQRLWAVEELNRRSREKEILIDKLEQLEAEKQSLDVKDKQSICWELLLRIDSMVLTGLINTGEASDLRNLVLDSKVSVADVFSNVLQKSDAELLAEFRHFLVESKKNAYHIIHICTEMEPLVSAGSLASYITGLCCALQRKGHLVEVILPKYASMDLDAVHGLREIEAEAYSYFNGQLHGNKIWTGVVHGIGVTFIQPLDYSSFFSRDRVYGYPDDFERFTYFSRASLDYIIKSGKKPDVLHIHNWETAIVGPLFWDIFVNEGLGNTKILLTCHSLDSQCLMHPDKLALCGLDPDRLHRLDRFQDNAKTHLINTLKGGIVYSNKVIILSSINSKSEIIRSLSHGLESTLSIHQNKLLVAPCGFNNTSDPYYDKFLPENYCSENLQGKIACKVALQQRLGLFKRASTILVGCIFSEVSDVVLENLKTLLRAAIMKGIQFIFMGTDKTPSVNRVLVSLQEELKGGHMRFFDIYDEALAHLIFAGSDIILCQSFHDPVLQVPLKALKYGAAPILVASDDIRFRHFLDIDHETTKFSQYMNSTFGNMTLSQALNEIKNSPSTWKQKIMDAMSEDFSRDSECCDIHVSAYSALENL